MAYLGQMPPLYLVPNNNNNTNSNVSFQQQQQPQYGGLMMLGGPTTTNTNYDLATAMQLQSQQQQQLQYQTPVNPPTAAVAAATATLPPLPPPAPKQRITYNSLIPAHRDLWRKISRMITIEIMRLLLQFVNNNQFDLGRVVCRSLVHEHFTVIFYDFLPYDGFNPQRQSRRRFDTWLKTVPGSDPLHVLSTHDINQITHARTQHELPDSGTAATLEQLNQYTQLVVAYKTQQCSTARVVPEYADNREATANESLRKLLHFLINMGIQMMNANHAFQLHTMFASQLLNFLLNALDARWLFVDSYLVEKMQLWADKTYGFQPPLPAPVLMPNTTTTTTTNDSGADRLFNEFLHFFMHRELTQARDFPPDLKGVRIENDHVELLEYVCGVHIYNYVFYSAPVLVGKASNTKARLQLYLQTFSSTIGTNEDTTASSSANSIRRPVHNRNNSEDGLPANATGLPPPTTTTHAAAAAAAPVIRHAS